MKRTATLRAIAGAAFAVLVTTAAIPATATESTRVNHKHITTHMRDGAPAPNAQPRAAYPSGKYMPYAPYRFFDTRNSSPLGPGGVSTLTFRPTDIPPHATAIVFNLTATAPSADTFVTAWPSGGKRPGAASINVARGETRSNQVAVPLGTATENGKQVPAVSFYNNAGNVHLLGDLEGFYATDTAGASGYAPTGPSRVLDTRSGPGPLGAGQQTTIDLRKAVPDGATAVTLNLTGIAHGPDTYVTAYPDGSARPNASSVNVGAGKTTPNLVTVALPASKKLHVYNHSGSTDVLADLAGYYGAGAKAGYQPVNPTRIADTRDAGGPIGAGAAREFPAGNAPSGAVAATMNLTGITPTADTFVTAYAAGAQRPNTSNLNLVRGQIASNVANAPLAGGRFAAFNAHGGTNLAVDLNGYFVNGE